MAAFFFNLHQQKFINQLFTTSLLFCRSSNGRTLNWETQKMERSGWRIRSLASTSLTYISGKESTKLLHFPLHQVLSIPSLNYVLFFYMFTNISSIIWSYFKEDSIGARWFEASCNLNIFCWLWLALELHHMQKEKPASASAWISQPNMGCFVIWKLNRFSLCGGPEVCPIREAPDLCLVSTP